MSNKTTMAEVKAFAERLGLPCETGRPGKGVRRFEFTIVNSPTSGHTSYCYGAREAWFFLRGFELGQEQARLTTNATDGKPCGCGAR